jgi:hypothetical protein
MGSNATYLAWPHCGKLWFIARTPFKEVGSRLWCGMTISLVEEDKASFALLSRKIFQYGQYYH